MFHGVQYARVRRLLISCPGDVPEHDLMIVQQRIHRWNVRYGARFKTVIVPLHWYTDAAARLGGPPQAIVNSQLQVDQCDFCIAVFANKLGTPTHGEPSGTAYEIQRFLDQGKYVGILRSAREVSTETIDVLQLELLRKYLKEHENNGITFSYRSDADLMTRVDDMLNEVADDRSAQSVEPPSEPVVERTAEDVPPPPARSDTPAEVGVRLDSGTAFQPGTHGPSNGNRRWSLVLHNTGGTDACDVSFTLEPGRPSEAPWTVVSAGQGKPTVARLAPGRKARFQLVPAGDTRLMRCSVHWSDERGRQQRTTELRPA
ncbi:hypothetical protein [Streptomyces griseorubiginosus]|uniref:hypothetical protein n=1 Tax=Streptomyces griseorubiginosus TaxID=67304 RepID=UPI00331CFC99